MFCRKCGQELPEDSKFCNNCGCEVKSEVEDLGQEVSQNVNSQETNIKQEDLDELENNNQYNSQSKSKSKVVIISVTLIILILGGIWYFSYSNSRLDEASLLYYSEDYYDASEMVEGLLYLGDKREEANKIKISGDVGSYYQFYKNEIDSDYEWDTVDYARAVELLFDGLELIKVKEYTEKTDIEKEIIEDFKDKYYRELDYRFDISETTVNRILSLDYDKREEEIKRIGNKVKGEIEKVEHNRNNPVEFRNLGWDSNSSYTIATGQVYNRSDRTIRYVTIRVAFKDKNGNVIDTDSTYAVGSEGLKPGESTKWRASVSRDIDIDSYSVSLIDFSN